MIQKGEKNTTKECFFIRSKKQKIKIKINMKNNLSGISCIDIKHNPKKLAVNNGEIIDLGTIIMK